MLVSRCPVGKRKISEDQCVDRDECLTSPCLYGGTCVNRDPGYDCLCVDNYSGINCGDLQDARIVQLSTGALAAILVCLLIILGKGPPCMSPRLKIYQQLMADRQKLLLCSQKHFGRRLYKYSHCKEKLHWKYRRYGC